MDYLVHQHITEGIECVTKGGMCMPFYLADGIPQRLSVDVDLATSLPASSVESAVQLTESIPNVTRFEKHIPSRQAVLKHNLVTYNVYYKSCFMPERRVKVDFLHSLDSDYSTSTVPAGREIIGFEIPHEIKILTRSALMADKFGTLAQGTIGLEASRRGEIAKQVYDIGVLLNGAAVDDIARFFAEFHNMLKIEKKINNRMELEAQDIVDSIKGSLNGMIVKGTDQFTSEVKDGYEDFTSTYISKTKRYERTDHCASILSIKILNCLVQKVLDGESDDNAATKMLKILANVGNVRNYSHVQELYGESICEATGIKKKNLERMNARLSCLQCAETDLQC